MSPPFFDDIFTPCTSPDSLCQVQPMFFFGTVGTCNITSMLCECPDGYSGIDDVARYNDCHVSNKFRLICHAIVLVLSSIAMLASAGGLLKLNIMWGVVFWSNGDEQDKNLKTVWNDQKSDMRTRDISNAQPPRSPRQNTGLLIPSHQPQTLNSHSSTGPSGTLPQGPTTPGALATDGDMKIALPPQGSPVRQSTSGGSKTSPKRISIQKNTSTPLLQLQSRPLAGDNHSDESGGEGDGASDDGNRESSNRTPTMVKRKTSRAPRLSIKPMQKPKTNVRSASFFQDLNLAKRRRNTCLLMSGFALHSIFGVVVFACFVKFVYMAEKNAGLLIALALSLACFQCSIWVLAYSWCGSLSSMKGYGKLFPGIAHHPLIRFPWLASSITTLCLVCSSAICIAFFFALPMLTSQVSLQQWVVPSGLTLIAALFLALTLFQIVVFSLLMRMFSTYAAAAINGSQKSILRGSEVLNEARGSAFTRARKTVMLVLILGCVSGPFVVVFLLIGAWTVDGRRNMYFFFSALFALANIVVIASTYVIVYRISSTAANQLGGNMTPASKIRKHGSKLASSQQQNGPSELGNTAGPSPGGSKTGPLMLALRQSEMRSKDSSDVQLN